ncbi:alpha/beta fold hydrolase [Kocuria sp.]|uniref:alpha/beta fold hydrolase n=1 Tax=Kocuria sp. TaxID=1871328 RepID=UPI0026E03BB6|nr:alpha/beta hydrolase [Kocuria sp.]MDO5617222.1 alpha/beta hydrolase [Kocuria sp.]
MDHHAAVHPLGEEHWATTRDGRLLYYMSRGRGPVTVVFESGMGFSRNIWGLVAPTIRGQARVVVYDRAGLGRSPDSPHRRTLHQLADDLSDLLSALGQGPFVLVGHSWGGPIVRTLAARNLHHVAGLILVDQSDEHWTTDIRPDPAWQRTIFHWILPAVAAVGLYRLVGPRLSPGRHQPPAVAHDHAREDFTHRAARTLVAEDRPYTQQMQRLHARSPQLGTYPVILISGTKPVRLPLLGRLRRELNAAHRRSADSAPNGYFVPAANSHHQVMFTDPEVITTQVHHILDQLPDLD